MSEMDPTVRYNRSSQEVHSKLYITRYQFLLLFHIVDRSYITCMPVYHVSRSGSTTIYTTPAVLLLDSLYIHAQTVQGLFNQAAVHINSCPLPLNTTFGCKHLIYKKCTGYFHMKFVNNITHTRSMWGCQSTQTHMHACLLVISGMQTR